MSLQFVMGASGSGKSSWMYRYVSEQAALHRDKNYVVLVPDQFTLETQKTLVALGGGIVNVDVLSFHRLAYRVFEERPALRRTVLEDMGKMMLLRRVFTEQKKNLKYFHKGLHKPGFLDECKSFLCELMQYAIDEDAFDTMEETKLTREFEKTPFVPVDRGDREERCNEILNIQAAGLAKRLRHTGCKSAVIGLSGGLDSTLALLVTIRAFDQLNLDRKGIVSVTMPCFGTTNRTYDNAVKLAQELGTTLKEISIEKAVLQHFKDIGHDPEVQDVTYENGQARERTQILMNIANQAGGLVIGTGDMSELALGWATYNGDHMSMYGVNCSVPKTLVRFLVQYFADNSGEGTLKDVLYDILDTPVSPELLPPKEGEIAQKTEDIVGPYELHDFFLYHMLRFGYMPSKIYRLAKITFEGEYEAQTIYRWLSTFVHRFFRQQFKRSCLPDGPKVGSVAVSPRGDLRMPSDASDALWKEDLAAIRKKEGWD